MPKTVFLNIYRDLRERIEDGTYGYQEFLPSENELTQEFSCSRSSIRRALGMLAQDGYVQAQQGKGVRVIRNPAIAKREGYIGLETFNELAGRCGFSPRTEPIICEEVVADEELAQLTGFEEDSRLAHILRARYADGVAISTDDSYYLAEAVPGLTPEVVAHSVYAYLEGTLGIRIATSRRVITIESASDTDRRILDLDGLNAVGVMRSHAFDADGIMIEYTESHQKPGFFAFSETALRPTH